MAPYDPWYDRAFVISVLAQCAVRECLGAGGQATRGPIDYEPGEPAYVTVNLNGHRYLIRIQGPLDNEHPDP